MSLLLFSGLFFAQAPDSIICLQVAGRFENAFDRDEKPCRIEVVRDGMVVDTFSLTKKRKRFCFTFERQCNYELRATKEGFVPLSMAIDTWESPAKNVLYRFEFTARLITEQRARTFNQDALRLPLAVIRYSGKRRNYCLDEAYTVAVKTRMVFASRKW